MAKKFLTGLNLVVLDVDPTTGSEGELYFNSSASVAKIYQAGSWSVLGAGGGGTTVSTTEPDSPETGDSWYKNDTGEFYVYDGTYWVEVNGVIASESFKTISVSGQSDVVADSNTDTLTLVAGTNVSITTNSTNDSITINADSKSTSSVYLVRNNTGSTILKGTLVSASGAEPSGRIDVEPFAAVGGINSELTVMGMATTNISNGVNGEVISFGTLTGLDTRGDTTSAIAVGDETWAAGDILFAHPTVAGKLTKVRPQHDLAVAFITVRHASTGQIAVRIAPGNNHLEWMHDVSISGSVQNNELLAYNSASGLWINQTAEEAGLLTEESASTTYQLAGDYVTLDGSQTISGDKQFTNSTYFTSPITISNGASAGIGWGSLYYANDGYLLIQATDEPGPYQIPGTGSVKIDARSDVIINSYAGGEYLGSIDPDNQIATVGILSEYLTEGSASSTYLTQVDASTTYITQIEANESFQPLATALSNISDLEMSSGFLVSNGIDDWYIDENEYLTTTSASSTFLSQEDAAVIYLSQSTAASAYQPVGEYLIGEDLNGYLTELSASTTYQPIGDYLIPTDLEGYLTESSASIAYQPLDEDLTQIALLNNSSPSAGFLKTTGPGYWSIDTSEYLTIETDPVFSASDAAGITSSDISNWNEAHGWGNHAGAGYALDSHNHTLDSLSNVEITDLVDGDAIVWSSASSAWINKVAEGGSSVTISSTAPTSPAEGDLWFDSDTLELFIYDSLYWIEVSGGGAVDLSSYLTIASASSTYLTQSSASLTYLSSESDTLETVTGRGSTSSNIIEVTNTTNSVSPTTGSLIVAGGLGISGDVYLSGNLNLAFNPTTALQAATKQYVDEIAQGLNVKPSVHSATTENLSANYNNGLDGVGATLTSTTNGEWVGEDGVLTGWDVFNSILVKDQTNKEENGRYYISDYGSESTPWILTRCIYCDTSDEIPGSYIFVTDGTLYAGTGWTALVDSPATFEIGTDDITYIQFSGAGTISAGTNIEIDGNEINVVDGPTFSGSVSINNLSLTNSLGYEYGGTGLTTIGTSGQVLTVNSFASGLEWVTLDALPDQSGNNGKYLSTDGSTASWETLDLSLYLTQSSASSTYLEQSIASSTYATITSPSLTTPNIGVATGTSLTTTGNVISHVDILTPTFTTNDYTLSAGDDGYLLMLNNSSSSGSLYVPTDAVVNFAIGTQITMVQSGSGQITILATTPGTTAVNSTPGSKLRAQWSSATLVKIAANTWVLMGDLST